jgi:hypothetical protein
VTTDSTAPFTFTAEWGASPQQGIDAANDGYTSQSYPESGQTDYTITLTWTTPAGCSHSADSQVNARGTAYSSGGTPQTASSPTPFWSLCIGWPAPAAGRFAASYRRSYMNDFAQRAAAWGRGRLLVAGIGMALALSACHAMTSSPHSRPASPPRSSPAGAPAGSYSYNLDTRSSCDSSTGNSTTCKVTLINEASSTGDFTWTAASDPPVALVQPDSGTVSKGASQKLTVTVPSGSPCPVKVTFSNDSGTSASVFVTMIDGAQCQ